MSLASIERNKTNVALALTAVGTSLAAGSAQAGVVTGSGSLAHVFEPQSLTIGLADSGVTVESSVFMGGPKLAIDTPSVYGSTAAVTASALASGELVGPGSDFVGGLVFAVDIKTQVNEVSYGLRSTDGLYGWVSLHDFSKSDPTAEWYYLAKYDYAFQTGAGCSIAAGSTTETCTSAPSQNTVPEPGGLALVAAGLVAAAVARRRSR